MTGKIALAIAGLTLAAVALGGCQTKVVTADGAPPLNMVTAVGTGEANATPDKAEMVFGVTVRDAKADVALDKASKSADAIIAAVKKTGVDAKDVQTQNVSVFPEYGNGNDGRVSTSITAYTATISVRATIRDIEKVGDVIAAGSGAGANDLSGPTFGLSEKAPARDTAIENAIADARHRAEVMAKASGKSLGGIIAVSEAGTAAVPLYAHGAYAAADSVRNAVPIEPGQMDITANVTVVFELK